MVDEVLLCVWPLHGRVNVAVNRCAGTRFIIYCTYFTLLIAIVLTILLKLNFDRGSLVLSGERCNDSETVVKPRHASLFALLQSPRAAQACYSPLQAGSNGTVWHGVVQDMNTLAGDVTVTLQLATRAKTGTVRDVAFYSTVEGTVAGWDHWNALYEMNSTFDVVWSAGGEGYQASAEVVNSFESTSGQGGGGYDRYRINVTYAASNVSAYGDASYLFQ